MVSQHLFNENVILQQLSVNLTRNSTEMWFYNKLGKTPGSMADGGRVESSSALQLSAVFLRPAEGRDIMCLSHMASG